MAEANGVEFRDIASGKLARVVDLGGPYDILRRGAPGEEELPLNSAAMRPCRAIVLPAGGTLTIVGLDDEEVELPDVGAAYQWNIQATAIVTSESGVVVIW